MSQLDHMTEREQFSTRGMLFRIKGDNAQCAKEYGAMVARFKADVIGRNQRANCEVQLRHLQSAVDEMKEVVAIIPKRAAFPRETSRCIRTTTTTSRPARKEGREVLALTGGPEAYGSTAVAMAQTATDRLSDAAATYRTLAPLGGLASAFSASGLGDLAIVEGRYAEAIQILGAAAAAEAKNPRTAARAATKLAAQAYAELMRGQKAAAIAAAEKALSLSQGFKIRFPGRAHFYRSRQAGDGEADHPVTLERAAAGTAGVWKDSGSARRHSRQRSAAGGEAPD
jgi:tetratricopeptide (TPR) repeat protein